ncbi:MAG: hypothetical protein OEZ32_10815 [Nitrospinota bacterium]|nr:hypothetical protein [Nitrospinota bacterium]
MRLAQFALVASLVLVTPTMAGEPTSVEPRLDLDLVNGKMGKMFVGSSRKEFAKYFRNGGETIGTWTAFRDRGYFIQHAGLRNMVGFCLRPGTWPDRLYGFSLYKGDISFGINGESTLESVKNALRDKFDGNFVVTLEEERGMWNRKFIAYQLTGWKTDPPFYFEMFFTREKKLEEIRLKSFPGSYYPQLLMDRALGPHAIDKILR